MKKITKIYYNWRQVSETNSRGMESGEDFDLHTVGKNGVTEIEEHPACGEGDKYFYYVRFENGNEEKIFNPNRVFFEPKTESNLHPVFEEICNIIRP